MVEVELYGNIFSYDYDSLGCLASDGTWFKNFWEFASHLDINIERSEEFHIEPVREGDSSSLQPRSFYDAKMLGVLKKLGSTKA